MRKKHLILLFIIIYASTGGTYTLIFNKVFLILLRFISYLLAFHSCSQKMNEIQILFSIDVMCALSFMHLFYIRTLPVISFLLFFSLHFLVVFVVVVVIHLLVG